MKRADRDEFFPKYHIHSQTEPKTADDASAIWPLKDKHPQVKKRWKVLINAIMLCFATLAAGISSFAQSSGDDPDSIYDKNYGHLPSPYTGAVPYVVFGAVILFLAFMGYRYWHDNAQE